MKATNLMSSPDETQRNPGLVRNSPPGFRSASSGLQLLNLVI